MGEEVKGEVAVSNFGVLGTLARTILEDELEVHDYALISGTLAELIISMGLDGEPYGYSFQHEETGVFVVAETKQVADDFERNNPRYHKIGTLYLLPERKSSIEKKGTAE